MNILLCSSTYEGITHGPAKFANLIMQINELYPEHEVRTITRDIEKETSNRIYKFERTYPPIIGAFWEYWDNQLFLNKIKEVLKSYDAEVIVFVDAVLGYRSAKAFREKIKTVGLINDDEYINNKISAIKPTKEWLIKWKSRQLEKRAARALDIVIGNSDFITSKIAIEYQVPQRSLRRLYKSIDIVKFEYLEHGTIDSDQKIKVFFVKNDYKRGGLKQLAESLAMLSEYRFKVYVSGPHDHQRSTIDSYFSGKENVDYDFKGKTAQIKVRQLMDSCDMLCVPALREGLGVANIEGLAKGIPVVGTNAGGIPEVLNGEECGWIAEAGDVGSLAETIQRCIVNDDLRIGRSIAGRKRVEQMFEHRKMLEDFLEIILEG